ncbi:GTP-binding protein [Candidatus Woesearchaeota archaeon]|nr:GTP-binding protein [Candidatus Woesearchaeota archaeon]
MANSKTPDKDGKNKIDEFMSFVIVGHVDHGKSTLIGRLLYDTDSLPTGKIEEIKKVCEELGRELEFSYVMDHLEEERQHNITIDTAQIFFKTKKRRYVIIDAPGHREFLKNMITGASRAEAAVLIIDAKEGVMEQTKRHAYILHLLGVKQVIVVINKMDLVGYNQGRFDEISSNIENFLNLINIIPGCIIPISAYYGDNITNKSENMGWYNGPTILESLDTFKVSAASLDKPLRYAVQDVYVVNGKRIIAGRVEAGKIGKYEEIIFMPSKKKAKVASIEVFNEVRTKAGAGMCIGVTIDDHHFIERGEIACSTNEKNLKETGKLKANVFWLGKEPLSLNERITFKCATKESECVIEKIQRKFDSSTLQEIREKQDQIGEREVGELIIRMDNPVFVDNFNDVAELGRFVLEKNNDAIAGGIILEHNFD